MTPRRIHDLRDLVRCRLLPQVCATALGCTCGDFSKRGDARNDRRN